MQRTAVKVNADHLKQQVKKPKIQIHNVNNTYNHNHCPYILSERWGAGFGLCCSSHHSKEIGEKSQRGEGERLRWCKGTLAWLRLTSDSYTWDDIKCVKILCSAVFFGNFPALTNDICWERSTWRFDFQSWCASVTTQHNLTSDRASDTLWPVQYRTGWLYVVCVFYLFGCCY